MTPSPDTLPADFFDKPKQSASPDTLPPDFFQGRSAGESHPLDSIGHGISEMWKKVNPAPQIQGLADAIRHPVDTAMAMGQQNADIWNKAKDSYSKGDYSGAIRHGVNYALSGIPGLGSGIEEAQDKISSGDLSGGVGSSLGTGLSLAAPAVVPKAAGVVGRGLQRAAIPIAESALGVRAIQRGYGKTPGQFALEETGGIRPGTVAESARRKTSALKTELENLAAASTTTGSLTPARDVIDARSRTASAGNSSYTPKELAEMRAHLTDPQPGFAGAIDPATGEIAADQSAANILRMKREFGKDYTTWNPLHPKGEVGTARKVYRALDDELDRTTPGAADLDQRISSRIPIAERGEETALHAGATQNLLRKAAVHTGAGTVAALTGAQFGPGAGLAAFVVPEMLSTPTARMAGARGIYGAGKLAAKPVVGKVAQGAAVAGALLRKDDRAAYDPLGLQQYIDIEPNQ